MHACILALNSWQIHTIRQSPNNIILRLQLFMRPNFHHVRLLQSCSRPSGYGSYNIKREVTGSDSTAHWHDRLWPQLQLKWAASKWWWGTYNQSQCSVMIKQYTANCLTSWLYLCIIPAGLHWLKRKAIYKLISSTKTNATGSKYIWFIDWTVKIFTKSKHIIITNVSCGLGVLSCLVPLHAHTIKV